MLILGRKRSVVSDSRFSSENVLLTEQTRGRSLFYIS